MKKRRQLDALISNGKLPRRKQSGHELLRSNCESDSSEVEEFNVLEGHKWGKRLSGSSCCSTCSTLTGIIILAACVVACTGLIWMHLELKRDFANLRERLTLVESRNSGNQDEFSRYNVMLSAINRTVQDIKTGTNGLEALSKDILDIRRKISSLESTTTQLSQQVLPNNDAQTPDLAKIVAQLGSDLSTAVSSVNTLKTFQTDTQSRLTDISRRLELLEGQNGREHGSSDSTEQALFHQLLESVNSTFTAGMNGAISNYSKLETRVGLLENFTSPLPSQIQNLAISIQQLQLAQSIQGQKTPESEPKPNSSDTSLLALRLESVENQVQGLGQSLGQILAFHASLNQSTALNPNTSKEGFMEPKKEEEFLVFRNEVFRDMSILNATMSSLNSDFLVLNDTVTYLSNDMSFLYTQIDNTMQHSENISTIVLNLVKDFEIMQQNQSQKMNPKSGP